MKRNGRGDPSNAASDNGDTFFAIPSHQILTTAAPAARRQRDYEIDSALAAVR
jgi:hypothetical protein